MRKIRHTDFRKIDGKEYTVVSFDKLNYSGEWEEDGFDVFLDDKFIYSFIGWPTDSDIRSVLTD